MATVTRNTAILAFVTSLGGTRTFRIGEAKNDLNISQATSAAELFMDAQPFDETIGQLDEFIGAEVLTDTIVTIF